MTRFNLPKIARSDPWEINLICSYQDHKPSMFECPFSLVDWSPSLARQYKPVGGHSASAYTGDYNELVYLRARYYAPYLNQFIQPDTIVPDPRIPADWNKYTYVRNNPINFVDPSGHISCSDSDDPVCIQRVLSLKHYGTTIKSAVQGGSLLPVEGFAQYVDYALPLFDNDIRGMMWALTITIDGFDANEGLLFTQIGNPNRTYWLDFDWLPYENNPAYDVPNWDGGRPWIHSRRGDWKKEYWDKTANQAFHFWFFVATTYFEGLGTARLANFVHDNPNTWEEISTLKDWEAPPVAGSTEQDWNLSNAGMDLGQKLAADRRAQIDIWQAGCESAWMEAINHNFTNPGAWIRSNLKGPVVYPAPRGR